MALWEAVISNVATSLLPLIILVFGLFARIGLPRRVNFFAGYRTPMACKNQETWAFAHKYVGRLWIILGLVMIIVVIAMLLLIERGTFALEPVTVLLISAVGTLLCVLLAIIPTEMALRKSFDKNGERRQNGGSR